MENIVKILSAEYVTHDVRQFRIEKPQGFTFIPGQATELSINKEGWRDKKNPFTFTGLAGEPYLEFIIKIYPSHQGVTENWANSIREMNLYCESLGERSNTRARGILLPAAQG